MSVGAINRMNFEPSYFENEVRENFFIPGMVKRSWAYQMDVLEKVVEICKKYNIRWFADYGTLMGAARHEGFIPWDDDLDICMFRNDYEKFNKVAAEELPEGYKILNIHKEAAYDNFLTRITGSNGINLSNDYLAQNHGFPYVAGIDIFPLDYMYPDPEVEENRRLRAEEVYHIINSVKDNPAKADKKEVAYKVKKYAGMDIDLSVGVMPALLRTLDTIFSEYSGEDAKAVTVMPFWVTYKNHVFPLEMFDKCIELPFETGKINVIAGYDKYLTISYGELWTKACRKGGIHDYPFFCRQEEELIQKGKIPPYTYELKDVEINNSKRVDHLLSSDMVGGYIKVLRDALATIKACIAAGNYSDTLALLQKCQEVAIAAGTDLENRFGGGEDAVNESKAKLVVASLEAYCEKIFGLFESISSQNEQSIINDKVSELKDATDKVVETYVTDRPHKEKVLILPVKAGDWNWLKPIYDSYMVKDSSPVSSETEVYVMPVPYASRGDDGNIKDSLWDYEKFGEDIKLIDYHNFDFGHNHFDKIYIQNPYDEYESGKIVHPFFYTSNIRDYCDKLIYVPPFELGEIEKDDLKSRANARYYLSVPGIIYSDEIRLWSQYSVDFYFEYLTEKAPWTKWEEKIKLLFSEDKKEGQPNSSCNKNTDKTIMLYISISDFFTDSEGALRKLKEVASYPVKILWAQEDNYEENLTMFNFQGYEEYKKVKDELISQGKATIISPKEVEARLDDIAGFYGSGGYVANICILHHKPVMLRNLRV